MVCSQRVIATRSRRFTLALLVLVVAAASSLAPFGGARADALTPIEPDNRPTPVPGASNGALPSDALLQVGPTCLVELHAAPSLVSMLADAHASGVALQPAECYRDLAGQWYWRDYWCARGQCEMAAVPGTSNHGWGKAGDFTDQTGELTFGSPGYVWLQMNAGRYGWNHPGWAEPSGEAPEPWHWEWVGDGGSKYPGMVWGGGNGTAIVLGGNPIGNLDDITSDGPGRLRVSGWVIDPDTADPAHVHVYVDGARVADVAGGDPRGDIGQIYPGYGALHGYSAAFTIASGWHNVCVWAINSGLGTVNPQFGCRFLVVTGNPVGSLDLAAVSSTVAGATVNVSGWAIDPDTAAPIEAHVYIDGVGVAPLTANQSRPDLAAAYPRFGGLHGFSWSGTLAHGSHQLCVYGINVGAGDANPQLGCRTVVVNRNPFGSLDIVASSITAQVTIGGWVLDPDTASPVQAHVYVDGVGLAALVADQPRNDIAAAFNGYGAGHGYTWNGTLAQGSHRVCVYGINVGPGDMNPPLGCTSVTVNHNPFGSVDDISLVATGAGPRLRVGGWVIDPDSTGATQAHVYVDGVGVAPLVADGARADIAAAFPSYGALHGYAAQLTIAPGHHTVCVYGINLASGDANPQLGCHGIDA